MTQFNLISVDGYAGLDRLRALRWISLIPPGPSFVWLDDLAPREYARESRRLLRYTLAFHASDALVPLRYGGAF